MRKIRYYNGVPPADAFRDGTGSPFIIDLNTQYGYYIDPATAIVKQLLTIGGGGGITAGTGDVTFSGTGSVATTIAANAVSNAKLATMAAETVKVNATSGSATPTDLALAASQLLGRGASGDIAAISLDPSLTMTGAVLSASGGVSIGLALQLPQVSVFIG